MQFCFKKIQICEKTYQNLRSLPNSSDFQIFECRPECLRVPRLNSSQLLLLDIFIAALHFNCAFMEFGFTIISLISVWICRFSWFENYGSQADFFLFIFKPCTDIVGYYVQYRSHFGSRYKSGRCVLRSPFRVLTSP